MANAEKKSIVHSVHRQPLSTETKEPMTGLYESISTVGFFSIGLRS